MTFEMGDAPATVMGAVQVVAVVLGLYLLVATVIAVLAEVTRSRALGRAADAITTAGLRRLVALAVGGALLAPASSASAEPRPRQPAEAPVLRRAVDEQLPAPPDAPAPEAAPQVEQVAQVVVEPGDHLWLIAERTLAERLGRAPTDGEVAPYWRQLVDANRGRLRSGDPDLIFAGERIDLPS